MRAETVLITGASSGIGTELARLFAADKSNLILVARRAAELARLAADLMRDHGVEVRVLPKDLARPEAPREVFEILAADQVAVDVLVNNAGFGAAGPFAQLDRERQLRMVRLNVVALTELCRRFLPGMLERDRGGILNVASTAAFQPGPYMAVYYATKAYVQSFTEAMAQEVKATKLQVTCLSPGPTTTEFAKTAGTEAARLQRLGSMTAGSVARSGYRGFRRGRVVVVPGLVNKLGAFSVRMLPRPLVRGLVGGLNR